MEGRMANLLEKPLVSDNIEKENECYRFAGEVDLEFDSNCRLVMPYNLQILKRLQNDCLFDRMPV
jgi:hypothetical protein